MKKISFLLLILLGLIVIPLVFSEVTYDLFSQDAYAILTTTSVNFSWNVSFTNVSLDLGNSLNCSVWNRSSSGGVASQLFADLNVTNATFANRTASLAEGRTYWYINCSTRGLNGNENLSFKSDERVLDIDLDYFTLSLGANSVINFTLDTGKIVASNNISTSQHLFVTGNITTSAGIKASANITTLADISALGVVTGSKVGVNASLPLGKTFTVFGSTNLTARDNKPFDVLLSDEGLNITTNITIGRRGVGINMTMYAPNGSAYLCGISNTGSLNCTFRG